MDMSFRLKGENEDPCRDDNVVLTYESDSSYHGYKHMHLQLPDRHDERRGEKLKCLFFMKGKFLPLKFTSHFGQFGV
jgi:hypothetical protein